MAGGFVLAAEKGSSPCHAVSSYLPATEVALATCVTNKAVDSIAEKLAAARLPFFVFGSSLRLGLVARRWTLDAQTDRDERVVIATARLAKPLRARQKLVSREERLKRIAAAAGARAKALQLVALFGASAQQPAPWTLSGALLPRLTAIVDRLMRELDEVRSEVSAELVLAARAVLGTVATASGSLLSDERAAPAVAKITTCVLDEAGACGESKLPLLLRLPLERIVAIGDQQQLKPFARADRPPLGFFQRLLMALPHDAVPCLATQYRMHPAIAGALNPGAPLFAWRSPQACRICLRSLLPQHRDYTGERGHRAPGCLSARAGVGSVRGGGGGSAE